MSDNAKTKAFDGHGHLIGCGKWADLWERHWGRGTLDETTRKNLDAMRLRGCPCRLDDSAPDALGTGPHPGGEPAKETSE